MYADENKTVQQLLTETLQSTAAEFQTKLTNVFRQNGYQALMVGHGRLRAEEPHVVVFENPKYAVIYLLSDPALNDAEFEVFERKARSFAWEHDAAAYFVKLTPERC